MINISSGTGTNGIVPSVLQIIYFMCTVPYVTAARMYYVRQGVMLKRLVIENVLA